MPLGNPGEASDYIEFPLEPPKERDDYERRTPYWLREGPEPQWALDLPPYDQIDDDLPPHEQRPDQMYHPPEWFDFPCPAIWRAGYSQEPYYPDAEEMERAKRLEVALANIEGAHNSSDPFRAAFEGALPSLPHYQAQQRWAGLLELVRPKRKLEPLR